MHLKKLSLLGFKSFPEATEVEFGPGMTGIVGPNGCGKTNILDALRWVLGEQRSSAMRGTRMEEVIFNGSRDAKPLGLSEVSLTIANSRGLLPTQYTDLTITRRLYRSGESEYMMNRQPCRLRDILDLFAGTGMGAHSYSVIQQDMIEAVLSDKPEERRFLFDEAAGVTKYKHRKRAALRKLEATEADLVRLKDIASEVRTRVNSLNRQSSKARRYSELKSQWEKAHLRLARTDYMVLLDRVRTQTTRSDNLKSDLEAVRAKVAAAEARKDALSAEVEEHEEAVEKARQELSQCEQGLSALWARKEKTGAEGRALAERQTEMQSELELQSARKRDYEHRLRELESELYSARAELLRSNELAQHHESKRHQSEHHWKESRVRQSEAGERFDAASARKRDLESELVHAETALVTLCEALTESEAAVAASATELKGAHGTQVDLERQEAKAQKTWEQAERALSEARAAREVVRVELQKAEDRLAAALASQAEAESRRSVLASWLESYEGYSGAVSDLLTRDRAVGLHDTVAETLRPNAGFEVAVAAALGERAEYLVCQNRAVAESLLERLERSNVGRATLVIMDALPETVPDRIQVEAVPLSDHVSVTPGFERLKHFLLEGYYLWNGAGRPRRDLLSPERSWVTRSGLVYRGRAEAAAGQPKVAGLLARKDELDRMQGLALEASARTRHEREQTVRFLARMEEVSLQVTRLEQTVQAEQERFREASLEAERGRARTESAVVQRNREAQLRASLLERVEESRAQIVRFKERRFETEAEYKSFHGQQLASLQAFDSSDRIRTEAILKSGEAQVHAVSVQAKVEGLAHDAERTREIQAEVEKRMAHLLAQITESGERRRTLSGVLATCAQENAGLEERRFKHEAKYKTLREGARDLLVRLQEREKEVKEARKAQDQVAGFHHDAEMAASEARLEVSNLTERVRDAHGVEIGGRSDLETVEAGQRGILALEVEELRARLDQMGTVNLLALEEYEEQNARLEFLDRQLADMEEAKSTLLDTITKINATARSQFEETFAKVEQNFSNLFLQLFEGGQAQVTLDLPEDPLESPISVMARPRGKKPVTILQLSGGERALTAIALLFALYMVKPSPFCILDEIDAPLDDANIGRFLQMLARFATHTQFIIITHNKMTMEAVDVLYGVTMENPGISRVVSVRLNEALEASETAA